jgi:hypothetical protein
VRLEGFGKLKKMHLIGTRTGDLPACSLVPQPTSLPRAPCYKSKCFIFRPHSLFTHFVWLTYLEVVGRFNRYFPLYTVAWRTTPPTIFHYRGNVFTELLPSNNMQKDGKPTDTRVKQFFYRCFHSLPRDRVYKAVA